MQWYGDRVGAKGKDERCGSSHGRLRKVEEEKVVVAGWRERERFGQPLKETRRKNTEKHVPKNAFRIQNQRSKSYVRQWEMVENGRGLVVTKNVFEFYCIPFDLGDNQPKNLYDVEEPPPPLPTGIKPFETCWDIPWMSTFAAAGSSLYCFGGTQCTDSGSRESLSSAIYCYDYEHNSESIEVGRWYTHSGYQMMRARFDPQIINIQGRMLLISGGGGTDKTLEDDDSWVEAFDPNSKFCSPESSMPIELRRSPLLTADLRSYNQILVASALWNAAFVFDVTTLVWKKFDQSDEFVSGKVTEHCRIFSCMEGKAAVVRDTILCWFGNRGNVLLAYDLNLKTWFKTPIKGLKKVGKLMPDLYDNDFSLLPLDYEHICLLWLCYSPVTFDRVLHCIKVLVSIHHAKEHPTVRASVISYRSYVLKTSSSYIEAVVLGDTWTAGEGSTSMDLGETGAVLAK
ncbi:hypothetical protein Vadar_028745 [Vaccinium darrowii]|uniref:Uncharacterized protein n=1 Tax=Vaccinium darrowii TaxID=229202 RepID=A0ACB7YRI4_9ERIC|nr:hypothetical protein Vadar_028745 [Vaccinium darrowii]